MHLGVRVEGRESLLAAGAPRRDGQALRRAEAARRGHGLGLAELVRRRRREGREALHVVLVPRRVRAREAADGGEPARATVGGCATAHASAT